MYPALAVVAELKKQGTAAADFLYLGRAGAIEERLALCAQIRFQAIEVAAIRGLKPWTAAHNLWKLYSSIGNVRSIIRTFKPDVIFVTGGFVSAPVVWAGSAEHVPNVIYLPDLEPGWSVSATAHWATRVAITFPEVARHLPKGKAVVTGYPVRPEFFQTNQPRAREMFGLEPDEPVITIFGGSRGAHAINEATVNHISELVKMAQVMHVTGRDDEAGVKARIESLPPEMRRRIRVYGYLDEQLPHALAAADIVVARAGAAILGEFPALGLPSLLVPYPYAGKHQERNAAFLVDRGAAVRVDNAGLDSELVLILHALLGAPEKLKKMGESARAMAQPRAAANIVDLMRSLAGTGQ